MAIIRQAPWRNAGSEAAGHEPDPHAPAVLLRGARLWMGDGTTVERGHLLMKDGRIVSVGAGPGQAPEGAEVVPLDGQHVTPGLIDTHSHMGVYPMPVAAAHADGNEMSRPATPGVRAVDAFWPHDPAIERALAGGVTTVQVLPGSGNVIGGRAVTLKLRPGATARQMHFRGAPDGLKMACGENPKRVYGARKQTPMTRMGNVEQQRANFLQARRLIAEWDHWRGEERRRLEKHARDQARFSRETAERAAREQACRRGATSPHTCAEQRAAWARAPLEEPLSEPKLPPKRDLALETLAAVLEGEVLVHVHCYRADDMASAMALAEEMGFEIRSFHHALEAYKIRRLLAAQQISVSTWADWWGFKLEAYDAIPENLALLQTAGVRGIVHSDSSEGIRRLNQEAAKALYAGVHAGLSVTPEQALGWITRNPAWALGVDRWTGTLHAGKDADVVVWSGTPFSVYARAERVYLDGKLRHDAANPGPRWSDFEAAP